ncbi:MAG: glycogen synthase GlgA [Ruminococcaceae bacterium]|nr:glycogen synthase GlgA [Oscillospiraceae bacterium]
MKILFVGAEAVPFISTGGLGDVLGSLPQAIASVDKNADVRVVLPLYQKIKEKFASELEYVGNTTVGLSWRNQYCGIFKCEFGGVTYYFLDNEYYFKRGSIYGDFDDAERFAFFGKAVLDIMPVIDFYPDIMHTNDWQSAASVIYLKRKYYMNPYYCDIKTIYTIHNIDYQGIFSMSILGDVFGLDCFGDRSIVEYNGNINLTKGAIVCADVVSTVSQKYANEIQTEFYSSGLHYILHQYSDKLTGIVNGIDVNYYNPENDTVIAEKFTSSDLKGKKECKRQLQEMCGLEQNPDIPVVSMISRLASHKGFDLVKFILPEMLELGIQFVLLGTGEYELEEYFKSIQARYPDKVKVFLEFNKDLSKKIYAGSDIFLMPSKSEPCGLSQMICSAYGTVPVVRETGGLYDTIKPYNMYNGEGNGFTFANYNAHEMKDAVARAVELYKDKKKWSALAKTAMETDFSWNVSANKYIEMYRNVVNK